MTNLSVSQIGTFQACSRKWELAYKYGLKRARRDDRKLSLGTLVHEGLAFAMLSFYEDQIENRPQSTQRAIQSAFNAIDESADVAKSMPPVVITTDREVISMKEENDDYWRDLVSTARSIVTATLNDINVPRNYDVVDVEIDGELVPLVEHWLEVAVDGTDFVVRGIVDVVLRSKHDGQVEVVDWKTRKAFQKETTEQLNMQVGIYQYMLHKMYGLEVNVGVLYQIKSVIPKSKKMEQFRPVTIIRNLDIQKTLWYNVISYAKQIETAKNSEGYLPRAYNNSCSWCTFRDICYAELHGYDVESIVSTMYEYKYLEEEEDDA